MEPKVILGVMIFVGLALLVKTVFFRQKRPQSKTFRCTRCSTISLHSERTIEAWRRGIAKLYCSKCHHIWLQSRPRNQTTNSNRSVSGCLSVIILVVVLPTTIVGFLKWFA
jgi:hypothetical protein